MVTKPYKSCIYHKSNPCITKKPTLANCGQGRSLQRCEETFCRWAEDVGLRYFEITGDGAIDPDSPLAGLGIWLLFRK
jgi:hypothetical protein